MERPMSTLTKSLLASIAVVGLLAGCATYDYGYGYSQPYYGYGYGYDYGPSYYDYGYYGPGYYSGRERWDSISDSGIAIAMSTRVAATSQTAATSVRIPGLGWQRAACRPARVTAHSPEVERAHRPSRTRRATAAALASVRSRLATSSRE